MRARLALPMFAVLIAAACSRAPALEGSGTPRSEPREVPAFSAINAAGTANVDVVIAATPSVVVEGDDNLVPLVETTVEGKTLRVGWKGDGDVRSKLPLRVKVTTPALTSAEVSGAASMSVSGLEAESFAARVSGAGSLILSGRAGALDAEMSGAGRIDAEKLAARDVKGLVSGAGTLVVAPAESLDAEVSGVGSIEYVGSPAKLEQKVSGVGSVRQRK